MASVRAVEMLVTVFARGTDMIAGDICVLPSDLAEELVRQKAAKYYGPGRLRLDKKGKKDLKEPWRRTLREGDIYQWQITIKLPHLKKPRIRARFHPDGNSSTTRFREVGGDGNNVSAAQARAINHLLKHQAALYPKMLRAVAKYADEFRPDWVKVDPKLADRVAPVKMTPADVEQRIAFTGVEVSSRNRNRVAYIEVMGECTWDPDHGIAIVLHQSRIVEVCQQGTGWVDRSPGRKSTD